MRRFSMILAMLCLLTLPLTCFAAEVDCDSIYCFSQEDFRQGMTGICVLSLPDRATGTVMLGSRIVQPGDILTAQQLNMLEFHPLKSEQEQTASISYLPVFADRVEKEATMVISIHGKEDKAPIAEDFAVETYKNLPNEGTLKVTDPEGQMMKYTIVRQPKRGTVEIREDGSFVYTPKHNKVGVDSFVFTASDPAGNVSREATVTIKILRPSDARQYADTTTSTCRFAAEWLKNKGIFVGEEVAGQLCFQPDAVVTRGQFLAMTMQALGIPVEDAGAFRYGSTADYLVPTLAAALRCGILEGLPEMAVFGEDVPVTGAEAAVMLQNILKLSPAEQEELTNVDGITTFQENPLAWAEDAIAVMADNGMELTGEVLTRGEVAEILYRAASIAEEAPGISLFR